MDQYYCQYQGHNGQKCFYICIEPKCQSIRVSCFDCFQDNGLHYSHQGLAIDEFQQKIKFRMQNLNKLKDALDQTKIQFNQFIHEQTEFVRTLILESKKLLDNKQLNEIKNISDYFVSIQDYRTPFVQEQLLKIRNKINKINKFIPDIKITETMQINEIKNQAMEIFKNNDSDEKHKLTIEALNKRAIQVLNKGLKQFPLQCGLIALKCTCLINLGQTDEAQRLINHAFQINYSDETVLLIQAKFTYQKKQYERCLEFCDLCAEPNKQLAFFKLDSLNQLQQQVKYHQFQKECLNQFGQDFQKEYQEHQQKQK